MKQILLFLIIAQSLVAAPFYQNKHIKQFPLDERTVYEIKVGHENVTTIMFPSAPTSLEGANIGVDPQQRPAFLISYKPGKYYFSVKANSNNKIATLNVVWNQKTYVLRFKPADEPYYTVTFFEQARGGGRFSNGRAKVDPNKLLALLDRAKSFHLIEQQYPEMAQQIDYVQPSRICFYKDFEVLIDEVFRFDPEDTLVFRVLLRNASANEIFYQPQSFAIRVGTLVYYQSISDASGIMPPGSTTAAYFAITGTPDGGRNELSVNNKFNILVSRANTEVIFEAATAMPSAVVPSYQKSEVQESLVPKVEMASVESEKNVQENLIGPVVETEQSPNKKPRYSTR